MMDAAILDQELDHILTLLSALKISNDIDALMGDDDFGDIPLATSVATTAAGKHSDIILDVNETSVPDDDIESLIFDPTSGSNDNDVQVMDTTDIFPICTSSFYQNGDLEAITDMNAFADMMDQSIVIIVPETDPILMYLRQQHCKYKPPPSIFLGLVHHNKHLR